MFEILTLGSGGRRRERRVIARELERGNVLFSCTNVNYVCIEEKAQQLNCEKGNCKLHKFPCNVVAGISNSIIMYFDNPFIVVFS